VIRNDPINTPMTHKRNMMAQPEKLENKEKDFLGLALELLYFVI
jgi:hypothetical protein